MNNEKNIIKNNINQCTQRITIKGIVFEQE